MWISIDEKEPLRFAIKGFISARQAHRHLFRHITPIASWPKDRLAAREDPERWSELIEEIESELPRRRQNAIDRLVKVQGCSLGLLAPTSEDVCTACRHRDAMGQVDREFRRLLESYEKVGRETFEWALANQASSRPRMVAFKTDHGAVRLKTVDTRRVLAVAEMGKNMKAARLVSAYRKDRGRSYRSRWLELCRERAGLELEGKAISIEQVPEGPRHVET